MTNIWTVEWGGTKSHSRRNCTMTIIGTDEQMTIPIEVNTKVRDIKAMLAGKLGIDESSFHFVEKKSSSHRRLLDCDEMRSKIGVTGIPSWERVKTVYPHPHAIIGAGHSGLRLALSYQKANFDYMIYDRNARVGGNAWAANANETTKLQTEFGCYHLNFDIDIPIPWTIGGTPWKSQPSAARLLEHFEEVCDEFGITPQLKLSTDVTEVGMVVTSKDLVWFNPNKQHYPIVYKMTDNSSVEEFEATYSSIAIFPGGLCKPKTVEYKGEDIFEGQIAYGVYGEFNYHKIKGEDCAIIGFGAFATENVRTLLEFDAGQIYLLCRRKNICMPRLASWLINQSGYPPTGAFLMNAMKVWYDLVGDDPWTFYSVFANKERTTCTIRQKARFGLGDAYFLASYYKKCITIVDVIKRLKPGQLHLEGGDKLDCQNIIKVLGWYGDFTTDKVMGVKEMVGNFINGDYRRWCTSEFPGIDAGKFGGTSFSPGAIWTSECYLWFLNYPKDLGPLFEANILPRMKPEKDGAKPGYVWDPRGGSQAQMIYTGGIIPGLAEHCGPLNGFAQKRQLEMHPADKYHAEVVAEWKFYTKKCITPGTGPQEEIPYPWPLEELLRLQEQNEKDGDEEAQKQMRRQQGG